MINIGFVIPSYNRADNLRLVLRGLERQTEQAFEIVVCDDGSTDNTEEVVASFGDSLSVTYCWREHVGYDPGSVRNLGVLYLPEPVTHIWFLDSDVVLNPGAVEHALVKHLEPHPEIIITGKYNWLESGVRQPPWRFKIDHRKGWDCNEVVRCSGATLTGNLVVPLDTFLEIGGFDSNLAGTFAEDCEFGYNLRSKGFKMVMCDGVVGYHLHHLPALATSIRAKAVQKAIKYIHEKYNGEEK